MYRHAPFFEAGTWTLPTTQRLFGDVEVSPFDDVSFIERQLREGTEVDQWASAQTNAAAVALSSVLPNPLAGLRDKAQGFVILALLALMGIALVGIGTYATIKKG
jgi:hypothetical protein